jgi:hypothetical protein
VLAGRPESAQQFHISGFDLGRGASHPIRRIFQLANILIVDDDPAVQITIRLVLERADHHVTVAGGR